MVLKPRPGIKQAYCAQSQSKKGEGESIKEIDRLLCDPYLNSAGFSTQVLPPIDIQNIRTHTRLLKWRNPNRSLSLNQDRQHLCLVQERRFFEPGSLLHADTHSSAWIHTCAIYTDTDAHTNCLECGLYCQCQGFFFKGFIEHFLCLLKKKKEGKEKHDRCRNAVQLRKRLIKQDLPLNSAGKWWGLKLHR